MNQWYTRDSDGCGQFQQKQQYIAPLTPQWEAAREFWGKEQTELKKQQKEFIHTNSINWGNYKEIYLKYNEKKRNVENITKLYKKKGKASWFILLKSGNVYFSVVGKQTDVC